MAGTILQVGRLGSSTPCPGVAVARQLGWHGASPGVPTKGAPFRCSVVAPLCLPHRRTGGDRGKQGWGPRSGLTANTVCFTLRCGSDFGGVCGSRCVCLHRHWEG